jgi:aromatic-L-amino-acid/L-tryptophan decarboxylase
VALGRRFRSLKLWFVLRHFGVAGIQAALRRHVDLARTFAGWIDEHPAFERLATTDFSVVVFRYRPPEESREDVLDRLNSQVLQRVNESGRIYLSHTRVGGRYALRLAVGNIRTELRHVEMAWQLAKDAAECSS